MTGIGRVDVTFVHAICIQSKNDKGNAMPLLQNHIAVVTGAGSGIGRAIANGYAREGARVVALDINTEAATETAKEIVAAGGKADGFSLDVADREACIAIAKQIADK